MSEERLNYIANKVDKIETRQESLIDSFNAFQLTSTVQIEQLKIKSGYWGLLGGAIPVSIGLLVFVLKRYL